MDTAQTEPGYVRKQVEQIETRKQLSINCSLLPPSRRYSYDMDVDNWSDIGSSEGAASSEDERLASPNTAISPQDARDACKTLLGDMDAANGNVQTVACHDAEDQEDTVVRDDAGLLELERRTPNETLQLIREEFFRSQARLRQALAAREGELSESRKREHRLRELFELATSVAEAAALKLEEEVGTSARLMEKDITYREKVLQLEGELDQTKTQLDQLRQAAGARQIYDQTIRLASQKQEPGLMQGNKRPAWRPPPLRSSSTSQAVPPIFQHAARRHSTASHRKTVSVPINW